MNFHVPDMSCGHCRSTVEKAVTDADPKAVLHFDMEARIVRVDSGLDADAVQSALKDAGYPAQAA